MKQYKGIAFNISQPLIGRISAKHNQSYIVETNNSEEYIITDHEVQSTQYLKINDVELNIGDVIKIYPNGKILVLYDVFSTDNALFVSEQCNNNCIMCPQILKHQTSNYLSENMEIISLLDPSPRIIGITGGEPTQEWNDLIQLIKHITNIHPETVIQLLTNGRIFKEERFIYEINKINSNILYCIPLYSDISQIHNKMVGNDSAFNETIEGLYNLAKYKVPIELRNVITKVNYTRLEAYASWVYYNLPFIAHLAIMGMEPTYKAKINFSELWIDPINYYDILQATCRFLENINLPFFIYNHQLCVIPEEAKKHYSKSISDFKMIYIDECKECNQKQKCGVFFESSRKLHSQAIKAIRE